MALFSRLTGTRAWAVRGLVIGVAACSAVISGCSCGDDGSGGNGGGGNGGGGTTIGGNTIFGNALVGDDGTLGGVVQVVHFFDNNGNPVSSPTVSNVTVTSAGDLDGQALTPDGSEAVLVDGGNTLHFLSGVNGTYTLSPNVLNVSANGSDGDSVGILPSGDEAVASLDGGTLIVVTGIKSGNPIVAQTITTPGTVAEDGLVISNDGKTMLSRGSSALTVYSITTNSNGTHKYTQTANLTNAGATSSADGRDGMAISPTDSSRAVIIGAGGSTNVNLITGLNTPTPVTSAVHLKLPASQMSASMMKAMNDERKEDGLKPNINIGGNSNIFCVSITNDGKYAVVGTGAGLVLLSGVDTGTLKQVGTVFNPNFTNSGGLSQPLGDVQTLAIPLNGNFVTVIALDSSKTTAPNGVMLAYPITSTGFGSEAGHLYGIVTPFNDQLTLH